MQHTYTAKNLPSIEGAVIGILQSKWHREYTDVMVRKCAEVLRTAGAADPERHVLPGSLELPLAARHLLRRGKRYDALIAFGAIIKGDTFHFEMVLNMCSQGLNQVMLEENVPIIVEVLPVLNVEQLAARSGENDQNKGIEAALAAIETISWRRTISSDRPGRIGVRME